VRILSPEGDVATARHALAPGPTVLAGARLAVLDNGKPNARLLLTTVAERLAARTGAEVALVVAKATAATPAEPEILQELRAADLVLTGSAD
jgi:hypothetical protein